MRKTRALQRTRLHGLRRGRRHAMRSFGRGRRRFKTYR